MRQTAGTLNRTWLAILGILALAAGTALLLQSNGTLHALLNTARFWESVVTGDLHAFFAQPWVVAVILIIGVIIGVLGLLWIIAQIPRKNRAAAYRLHDDGSQGFTLCDSSVLAAAVEKPDQQPARRRHFRGPAAGNSQSRRPEPEGDGQ